jgi:hypothetical protein
VPGYCTYKPSIFLHIEAYLYPSDWWFFFLRNYNGLRKYSPPWHFSYFSALQPEIKMYFWGGLYHLIYTTFTHFEDAKYMFYYETNKK